MQRALERIKPFWPFQIGGWSAYGLVLILSSIPFANDTGAVAYRATLAATCFLASFLLRRICGKEWRRGFQYPLSLLIVGVWCLVLTLISAALALIAEYTFGTDLRPFTPLISFTAIINAGFILLSWSALYLGIKYNQAAEAERHRLLAAERSAREAELRALRYQIHPHFLFNTLNAISTLVLEGQNESAVSMITRLAAFFRTTLEGPTTDEVTLENELNLAKEYLEIEKLRFGDRLSVEIDVNTELRSNLVPHLVLQPLIENAIRHGIAPRSGTGTLSIVANCEGKDLIIMVADDGLGRQARNYSSNGGNSGIGLKNVNQRLQDLYGCSSGLQLIWPDAGGCQAILKIPFDRRITPAEARS